MSRPISVVSSSPTCPQRGAAQAELREAVLVRAAPLPADLGDLWTKATRTERAEIATGLFAEVRVRDEQIVGARQVSGTGICR